VDRTGKGFPYLVHRVSSGIVVLPYLRKGKGSYEKSSQGVVKRYLTVVPAISNALEGPTYGCDDTEGTCDPMTATEDEDRLDYARGSSTKTGIVGSLVRI